MEPGLPPLAGPINAISIRNSAATMLGTRVVSGISMIVLLAGVLFLDEWFVPWFPFWFALCLLTMAAAAIELVNLLRETSSRPSVNSVLGGVLALVIANWAPHVIAPFESAEGVTTIVYDPAEPINALAWPFLTFVGVLMVCFVVQSVQFVKPGRTMATIAGTVLAVAYIGLLGSFMIQMRWLEGRLHGILPLLFLVACAKGADTGAYTFGRLAGRHKLWPSLSPNKTIEGAVGGLFCAILASFIVTAAAQYVLGFRVWSWTVALAFGLLIGVAAQLGDLMESMIKRDCEQKDASAAVPGFGGVLDVLDSLLFSGPVAYGFWLSLGP